MRRGLKCAERFKVCVFLPSGYARVSTRVSRCDIFQSDTHGRSREEVRS